MWRPPPGGPRFAAFRLLSSSPSEALMTEAMTTTTAEAYPAFHVERVLWVKHWTDQYFSFAITRPASFRFRSGEFVMIGLPGGPKPVMRAYSIASPGFAEELEFLSIKVEDGPLTSRLQKIQPGDEILLGRKSTGTLVLDALTGAKNLYLISTGTGLAPFLSLIRDPETFERFERVHVAHTVRQVKDLCYSDLMSGGLYEDPLVGEEANGRFVYYPTVTREAFQTTGRITDRILAGALFQDLGFARDRFDPAEDRIMLCGSMAMIKETAGILEAQGLVEGSNSEPGDFVIERAFVG
ncbi:MAG: ferredoxin--NADP reductase [Proteobacteria bacterium]|nr:ferredoxin--NADP reductase [Pseudomonadota bacterium]